MERGGERLGTAQKKPYESCRKEESRAPAEKLKQRQEGGSRVAENLKIGIVEFAIRTLLNTINVGVPVDIHMWYFSWKDTSETEKDGKRCKAKSQSEPKEQKKPNKTQVSKVEGSAALQIGIFATRRQLCRISGSMRSRTGICIIVGWPHRPDA